MSGVFGPYPHTFASVVTATTGMLDDNFNTVTAYLNDPTNRNNYAADGAATNTVVVTFSPAVATAYSAGLELTWKWGVTNTGAVVLNANGLGNINVVNPNGSALVAGQGQVGSIGKAVYDGTRAIFISANSPASAADVSAATTLAAWVSPGRIQNHPGAAKSWGFFNGTITGTISALQSYNVASIVRLGTGTYTISFSTPMASGAYPIYCNAQAAAVAGPVSGSRTANGFAMSVFLASTGVVVDVPDVNFLTFGTQ